MGQREHCLDFVANADELMSGQLWAMQVPPTPAPVVVAAWSSDVATPAAITASRARLQKHVVESGLDDRADDDSVDALLLTYEELTSNAVRHGRLPVCVTVTTTADGWLVDVQDCATERGPVPAVDRDPARGGLGLHLVARLSAAHGWWIERQRKHVWASIQRIPAAN